MVGGGGVGGHPSLKQICDTDCLESIAYEFYKKRRVKMMPKKLRWCQTKCCHIEVKDFFFRNAYNCKIVHVNIFLLYSWCNLWIRWQIPHFGYLYLDIHDCIQWLVICHWIMFERLLHFITVFSVCVSLFFSLW